MTSFLLENALLGDHWARSVRVTVGNDGVIEAVSPEADLNANSDMTRIAGHTLPGIANLHSHAFQRAMAGLAERAGPTNDSFWTWRKVMYAFLDAMKPEHVEAIAAQLYIELLKHGYTSVAEFHYLHHQSNGSLYDNPSEMSDRIIAASTHAGIGLCHLPVLYGFSGFGEQPPTDGQRRFINTPDQFLKFLEDLGDKYSASPTFNFGMAAHSLRAVSPASFGAVLEGFKEILPGAPIHIHIAEQLKEVEDCVTWCGKRPVEFLYEQFAVDKNWCLIHATHLNDAEVDAIAASGAVAGICPTTEANLGDGIFPAVRFMQQGGTFGVGTDSHISVSLADALRSLEYSQRLQHLGRNILASEKQPSTGMSLLNGALQGGQIATGFNTAIVVGARADFVVLDNNHPAMIGRSGDSIVDSFIFANSGNPIRDVYVAGKAIITNGRHLNEDQILSDFATAIKELQT